MLLGKALIAAVIEDKVWRTWRRRADRPGRYRCVGVAEVEGGIAPEQYASCCARGGESKLGEGCDMAGERLWCRSLRSTFLGGTGHADVEIVAVDELTIDSVQIVRCDWGDMPNGSESAASFSCVLLNTVLEEWSESGVPGLARGISGAGMRLFVENLCLLSLGTEMCRRGRAGVTLAGDS
jgi:hypothetical protein